MAESDPKVEIFMPLYVGDYDRDTADLSFEEHGFYQAILRALWVRGGCLKLAPSTAQSSEQAGDKLKLARILRTDVETFSRLWPSVERFFIVRQDGTFFQKRLSHELNKAKNNKAFAVERARKGGEARAARLASSRTQVELKAPLEDVPQAVLQASTSPSPSDPDLSLSSPPLASHGSGSGQTRAKSNPGADGPALLPPAVRHPIARLGTLTPAFLAVFERYPRQDKRMEASQVFAELADGYAGGEDALSAAILAAFEAGMLARHPYRGPNATRPCLDRVLAERRWEDPLSAPDDAVPGRQSNGDKTVENAAAWLQKGGQVA